MIFIPGNVPSLKNSKVKAKGGIFASPAVGRYLRALGIQTFSSSKKTVKGYVDKTRPNKLEKFKEEIKTMKLGKENPLFIGFHQVRDSKRKFDFSNSVELIQDLFVAHDFIEDDNIEYMFPIPMTIDGRLPTTSNLRKEQWYSVDKENPGVYIKIF
ncbi:MAG: hypothetical protein ACSLE0_08180 [Chitinophagaceae bacterium]